jgi:hypothetical protein
MSFCFVTMDETRFPPERGSVEAGRTAATIPFMQLYMIWGACDMASIYFFNLHQQMRRGLCGVWVHVISLVT